MSRETLENVLRKIIIPVGHAVERVIGQAKKAKQSVGSGGGMQPILALESQLQMAKLKELISKATTRVVEQFVPMIGDKPAVELCDGPSVFGELLKGRGASQVIHVDIGASTLDALSMHKNGIYEVRAQVRKVPFEDNYFHLALACLTTSCQGEFIKAAKEIGRMVAPGGDAIFTDFHPFGLYAKKGSVRIRPREANIRGLEDYYKICKVAGFRVTDVREVFIDEAMRPYFVTPDEKAAFKGVKETPLIICLFAKKVE